MHKKNQRNKTTKDMLIKRSGNADNKKKMARNVLHDIAKRIKALVNLNWHFRMS